MDPSAWQRSLTSLQSHATHLDEAQTICLQRFSPFRTLFTELMKSCDKFATGLAQLADSCDQEVISTIIESEESLASTYASLRTALLGTAESWRIIAVRSKNQILQPLKVFADNYRKVSGEVSNRLKQGLGLCVNAEQEVIRAREAYYTCCEKLQRHKESQAKIMTRIQNGDSQELEKFNRTTKNLLERVGNSQTKYMDWVERANEETNKTKASIQKQLLSVRQNQTTRIEFIKKIAGSQVKILELARQTGLGGKVDEPPKFQPKNSTNLKDAIERVEQFCRSTTQEMYISHEELIKSRKHKQFEQQNPLLMELFNKVKEGEKGSMLQFVHGCLQIQPACQLISVQRMGRMQFKTVFPPQWQTFREKILSLNHYSFYFAFLLNRELNELPNYYIKLTPPFYQHLLALLTSVIDRIDLMVQGTMGEVAMGTFHKLLKLTERIVQKKESKRIIGSMKVMIEGLNQCKKLRDEKVLHRLLKYLVRKSKRRTEPKGVVGFTKGLLSSLTGKKDEGLSSEEEQFNSLVELTHIMANLSLSPEIALPFLKNTLKNSGEASYQYLKDIMQGRRDREQRQKLLLEQNYKSKFQRELNNIVLKKRQAVVCIRLTAQRGFMNKEAISLRLVCRQLSKIHLEIIYRLIGSDKLQWSWICDSTSTQLFVSRREAVLAEEKVLEVEDIIGMDVNRSLHIHAQQLPPEQLNKFLVLYARQHPKLSYYQGMNYLAGYLLLKMKDQSRAYSVFCFIMEHYFAPIFVNSFQGMRLKLYMFDRLLSIFHPDLSDHFKREMITPQCYVVGWIITVFTSSYQYTLNSFLVDWVWDRFVLWGWREFYRTAMWIMQVHREVLLGAGYDKCLQILGQIPKSKLLLESDQKQFLKAWGGQLEGAIQGYSISDDLLGKLSREFLHE